MNAALNFDSLVNESRWDEAENYVVGKFPDKSGPTYVIQLSIVYQHTNRIEAAEQLILNEVDRLHQNSWILLRAADFYIFKKQFKLARIFLNTIADDHKPVIAAKDRMIAGIEFKLGNPDVGYSAVKNIMNVSALSDNKLTNLFEHTFCKRIRTNSLFTPYTSNKQCDEHETNRLFDLIKVAVKRKQPFSLIRLADGEGNFLADSNRELVGAVHCKNESYVIGDAEFATIREQTLEACDNADVLGLPREDMMTRGFTHVISGLRTTTLDKLESGQISLTDCHCHYALQTFAKLHELMSMTDWVGYIGGRDLSSFFTRKYPDSKLQWYQVPVQARQGDLMDQSHYPYYFNDILDTLEVPHPGALFLIAAGVIGKIYANEIKKRGGIAIDIGAVADLWVNRTDTRAFNIINSGNHKRNQELQSARS